MCRMDAFARTVEGRKRMTGKCDMRAIMNQSQFCTELMLRLDKEINASGEGSWSGMENHVRKQDDIKRIRRELMTLAKMLDPWGGGTNA